MSNYMYKVIKRMEISISHKLSLDYDSPCCNLHGHNLIVEVEVSANKLNSNGMVVDFKTLKNLVHDKFDHKHINDIVDFNPTAELLCTYICNKLNEKFSDEFDFDNTPKCTKVTIQETEGNIASFEEKFYEQS